jgi:hypothetical protein
MTIENELLSIQNLQQEYTDFENNPETKFMSPELVDEIKKEFENRLQIYQQRIRRKQNIADTVNFANESSEEAYKAKRQQERAEMNPVERGLNAVADYSAKTIPLAGELASNIALGGGGFLARSAGNLTGWKGLETIGEKIMQANRDFKNWLDIENSFPSYFEGNTDHEWNSVGGATQNVIGGVGKFMEGYHEFAPLGLATSGVGAGIGMTGKALGAGEKAVKAAQTAANLGLFASSNVANTSDYIEQTSGKFKPIQSGVSSAVSALAMEIAFALGRGRGMNNVEASNYATRMLTENQFVMMGKKAFKQSFTTAIANGLFNGGVGTWIREEFALPENATQEDYDRLASNVWEAIKHETAQGAIWGGFGAIQYHNEVRKLFNQLGGKKTIITPDGEKRSVYKINASAKFISENSEKLQKEKFPNLFETGSIEEVNSYLDELFKSVPEKLILGKSAEFGEQKENFKAALLREYNLAYTQFNSNSRFAPKIRNAKENKEAQTVNSLMANKVKGLYSQYVAAKTAIKNIDIKIEASKEDLQKQQELARQKEELQLKSYALTTQLEKPYSVYDMVGFIRNALEKQYGQMPEFMKRVDDVLSKYMSDNWQTPIGADEAMGVYNQITGELSKLDTRNVYDDYNSKINNIVNFGQPTVYGNDERNIPTSALPNNTQPQSVLPSPQETPLLEYNPTGRRQMPISEGSNQPINNMDVGSKVNRESPSSFGIVNNVPRSVNMLEKPNKSNMSEKPTGSKKENVKSIADENIKFLYDEYKNMYENEPQSDKEIDGSFDNYLNNLIKFQADKIRKAEETGNAQAKAEWENALKNTQEVIKYNKEQKSNISEKPTGSADNIKPSTIRGKKLESPSTTMSKSQKPEALQTSDIMVEKGKLKDRDMPMAVSQLSSEPMAVKKESVPKTELKYTERDLNFKRLMNLMQHRGIVDEISKKELEELAKRAGFKNVYEILNSDIGDDIMPFVKIFPKRLKSGKMSEKDFWVTYNKKSEQQIKNERAEYQAEQSRKEQAEYQAELIKKYPILNDIDTNTKLWNAIENTNSKELQDILLAENAKRFEQARNSGNLEKWIKERKAFDNAKQSAIEKSSAAEKPVETSSIDEENRKAFGLSDRTPQFKSTDKIGMDGEPKELQVSQDGKIATDNKMLIVMNEGESIPKSGDREIQIMGDRLATSGYKSLFPNEGSTSRLDIPIPYFKAKKLKGHLSSDIDVIAYPNGSVYLANIETGNVMQLAGEKGIPMKNGRPADGAVLNGKSVETINKILGGDLKIAHLPAANYPVVFEGKKGKAVLMPKHNDTGVRLVHEFANKKGIFDYTDKIKSDKEYFDEISAKNKSYREGIEAEKDIAKTKKESEAFVLKEKLRNDEGVKFYLNNGEPDDSESISDLRRQESEAYHNNTDLADIPIGKFKAVKGSEIPTSRSQSGMIESTASDMYIYPNGTVVVVTPKEKGGTAEFVNGTRIPIVDGSPDRAFVVNAKAVEEASKILGGNIKIKGVAPSEGVVIFSGENGKMTIRMNRYGGGDSNYGDIKRNNIILESAAKKGLIDIADVNPGKMNEFLNQRARKLSNSIKEFKDKQNAKEAERQAKARAEQEKAKAELEAENNSYGGFLDGKKPFQQGAIKKALDKKLYWQEKSKSLTTKEVIDELAETGKLVAKEYSDNGKKAYAVGFRDKIDGSDVYSSWKVGKTAYEYAKFKESKIGKNEIKQSRAKNKTTNPVTDKELNNFLKGQAKQISKETGLNFKVVDSVDELRKMFPNNDITDTVEGGIHKDTVYLVKGNIDKDRLPLVIAHEVAGHRGVESLFESKQQMDNFFNSLERAAVKDKFIREAFAEVDRLGYKENRSREAMAKIVEKVRNESGTLKGTAKTFVNFITSRVRRFLRKLGFKNLQLNEAEVYDLAVQALRRTGLKNSNKFFGLDRFLAKDNSFLSAKDDSLKSLGMSERNSKASWTDERIDNLIDEYGAKFNDNYSKAYATRIDPVDYLKLTLGESGYQEAFKNNADIKDLNVEQLRKQSQTPFLVIRSNSENPNEVVSHEGRHRMLALAKAGIKSVPVVIVDTDTKTSKKTLQGINLDSQSNIKDKFTSIIKDELIPIKNSNREAIKKLNGEKADIQFSIGERKSPIEDVAGKRKVKPNLTDELAQKIIDEVGEVRNPKDYNAVKKIAKENMAEYKDLFSTKKNTGYKTAALKLHHLIGYKMKNREVEKNFRSIKDFDVLKKTAGAYIRNNIDDKSAQANLLDKVVKANSFEKVYDIITNTNITKEKELRQNTLNDFVENMKNLKAKKVSSATYEAVQDIIDKNFTEKELDGLLNTNEFTTEAVSKLRDLADGIASGLGNISKTDVEVAQWAIDNARKLKKGLNNLIQKRKEGDTSLNIPVEKLAEVNTLLNRLYQQEKEARKALDTSLENAAVADKQKILAESPEAKNPNDRNTYSLGTVKENITPVTAVNSLDNDNIMSKMGKTIHKVAYENLLEGQNKQDHYRAEGYKVVDDIYQSFGKNGDLRDGMNNLNETAMQVKTSKGHTYDITKGEVLAAVATYMDSETRQIIDRAGGVDFFLGAKRDSDYFTFTTEELKKMTDSLTPLEKKALKKGSKLLSQVFLPAINETHERLNGVPLRIREDGIYFPRFHVNLDESIGNGIINRDSAPYLHQQMNADYQAMLKQRNSKARPSLMLKSFPEVLNSYVDQGALYIGMAEPLRHLNRVMTEGMKRELISRYGKEYVDRITTLTKNMAGMASRTDADRGLSNRFLSNIAAAKLTPVSAIKQFSSVPLASSIIDFKYLAKAALSGLSNENINEMMKLDSMILRYRNNGIAGIIPLNTKTWEGERQLQKHSNKWYNKIVDTGLNLSVEADKRALGIIYKATKLMAEAKGKGNDKAWIEKTFMDAVRRTQNTTDLASANGWQMKSRESAYWSFLNMYQNQTQKIGNEAVRLFRGMKEAEKQYGKESAQYKEAKGKAVDFAIGVAIMNAMSIGIGAGASAILHKKDEKETARQKVADFATDTIFNLTGNPILKPVMGGSSYVLRKSLPKALGGSAQRTQSEMFGNDFTNLVPDTIYTAGKIFEEINSDDPVAKKFRKVTAEALRSKSFENGLAMGRVPTWFLRYPSQLYRKYAVDESKSSKNTSRSSTSLFKKRPQKKTRWKF